MNQHTTRRSPMRTGIAAAALLASLGILCAVPPVQAASPAAIAAPHVTKEATVGPYHVVFAIGPMEKMYTPAQVKKLHPKDGEVMLSGMMAPMGTMKGRLAPHHLEVHISTARGGQVITTAHVAISLTDLHTKATTRVPIMTMQGIISGKADFHYGNIVMLMTEHYRVDVTINGVPVHFTVVWQTSGMSTVM